jgi:hypothetical protein
MIALRSQAPVLRGHRARPLPPSTTGDSTSFVGLSREDPLRMGTDCLHQGSARESHTGAALAAAFALSRCNLNSLDSVTKVKPRGAAY